jgi:hypothetical protein
VAAKTITSINGWPVILKSSDPALKDFLIPGTKRKIKLRKDVGGYLVAFAAEYHQKIRPIDEGILDDWGWCPLRDGRASNSPSDHCAGVAIDVNATKEGAQGSRNRWWITNPVKYVALKSLLKKYRLLEAGITYSTKYWDPMHFVIKHPDPAGVKAEMVRLGIAANGVVK